jgi:hypothetical protein
MELHGIAANLDSDKAENDTEYQEPMKQADRKIPDANDFFHLSRINQSENFSLFY